MALRHATPTQIPPVVAVIIPTLNAASTLKECLDSIARMTYPKENTKVIVVDGGSQDSTVEKASEYGSLVMVRKGTSRGAACNEGAKKASGDIVAFTDADAVVNPDWLAAIVSEMGANHALDAVGGLDLGLRETPAFARASTAIDVQRRRKVAYGWKAVYKIKGVNSAYRLSAFLEVGGFDPTLLFGEESDLHARMVALGKQIKFVPSIVVYHRRHVQNLRSLTRAFRTSRRIAPLLFRSWTLRAALHDPTSPFTTLLMLVIAACLSIPLVILLLIKNFYLLVDLIALGTCVFLAYSLRVATGSKDHRKLSLFASCMVILPIQSVLRAAGAMVGAMELLYWRIVTKH
jgi:cellulose synthase/poly-beta-1,6-N-acetylglucosamine synthase-like glycosyltransferase